MTIFQSPTSPPKWTKQKIWLSLFRRGFLPKLEGDRQGMAQTTALIWSTYQHAIIDDAVKRNRVRDTRPAPRQPSEVDQTKNLAFTFQTGFPPNSEGDSREMAQTTALIWTVTKMR